MRERTKIKNEWEKTMEIECKICGKALGALTTTHLRNHGISMQEYREMFPEAKVSLSMEEKQQRKKREKISTILGMDIEQFSLDQDISNLLSEGQNISLTNFEAVKKVIKQLFSSASFDHQFILKDVDGTPKDYFFVDVAVPEGKFVIEFPNSFFHNSPPHLDILKKEMLREVGWETIVFSQRDPTPGEIIEYFKKKSSIND